MVICQHSHSVCKGTGCVLNFNYENFCHRAGDACLFEQFFCLFVVGNKQPENAEIGSVCHTHCSDAYTAVGKTACNGGKLAVLILNKNGNLFYGCHILSLPLSVIVAELECFEVELKEFGRYGCLYSLYPYVVGDVRLCGKHAHKHNVYRL